MKTNKIKKGGFYVNFYEFLYENIGNFLNFLLFSMVVITIVFAAIFPFRPRFYM